MKRMISSISALAILVFSLCICSCGKDEVMVAFAARGGEISGKTSFEISKILLMSKYYVLYEKHILMKKGID